MQSTSSSSVEAINLSQNAVSSHQAEDAMTLRCSLALMVTLAVSTPAVAQSVAAGRVKVVTGAAFIVRQQVQTPAKVGDVVFETDTLTTGPDGRIGVTMKDETRISLGPASEVRLDRFVYAPANGQFAFVLNIVRGLAAYVSGRIAKLSPDAVRLVTPTAIVGVRGTHLAVQVPRQ
jgi:hypothetical protein